MAPLDTAKSNPDLLETLAGDALCQRSFTTPGEWNGHGFRSPTRQTPVLSATERRERLCLPAWVSQTTSTAAARGGRQRSWACSPPTAAAGAWPAPWWWAGGCPLAFWACSCCRSAVVPAVAPAAAPAVSGSGGGRTRGISLPASFAWVGAFAALKNLAAPQLLRHQSYRRSLHL